MATVTKTLRSSGGDYSLMSTWESTEQTDLVTDGDSHVLDCYNDWPSGLNDKCLVQDWTTSPSNTLTIKAADGEGHGGVDKAGFWMYDNTAFSTTLDFNQAHGLIKDIQVQHTTTTSQGNAFRGMITLTLGGDDNFSTVFENCICTQQRGTNATSYSAFRGRRTVFKNCLAVKSCYTPFANHSNFYGNVYLNCTAEGATYYGFYATAGNDDDIQSNRAYNCVAYNNTSGDFSDINNNDWRSSGPSNNASEDTTAPGASPVTGITSADFKDAANDNYRPESDSSLYDAGTDLSAFTYPVSTDIRGQTRDVWSIGAYENDYNLKTLKSSGGDYSLMSTWESTEQTDLTASGEDHILECDAFTCTESIKVTINGWTVNDDNNITIRPADGAHHKGVWDAGFILQQASSFDYALSVAQQDIYISGIQVQSTTTGQAGHVVSLGDYFDVYFREILVSVASGSGQGITAARGAIENCVVRNTNATVESGSSGIAAGAWAAPDFRNCTVIGHYIGAQKTTGGNVGGNFRNVVCYDNDTDFGTMSTLAGYSYLASGDSTATGTGAVTGITSADFFDYANDDFRIDENSDLYGAGTHLLTTDIRGATRVAANPSIGAYKFDVVTKTLKSSGGDYSTMPTAESAEERNLVPLGEKHIFECYAYQDNASAMTQFLTWDPDALCTLTIQNAAGNHHLGVPGDGYKIRYTGTGNFVLQFYDDYTYVKGIELEHTSSARTCLGLPAKTSIFEELILTNSGGGGVTSIGQVTPSSAPDKCIVRNCVMDGRFRFDARCSAEFEVVNNTMLAVSGAAYNILVYNSTGAAINATFKNNVVYGGSTDSIDDNGTTITSTPNMDSNAWDSTNTTYGTNAYTIASTDFENYAGGDYTPKSTSDMAGNGVDFSSSFTNDIETATRSTWDIGAWIATAAATGGSIVSVTPSTLYDGQTGIVIVTSNITTAGATVKINGVTQNVTGTTADSITITAERSTLSLGSAVLEVIEA